MMKSSASPRQFVTRWRVPRDEMARRSLASAWIEADVPKWVTLIDEALFVLVSVRLPPAPTGTHPSARPSPRPGHTRR